MKILVVDDEPIARRRLVRMLERISDVEVIGQAGDGEEALQQIEALSPDAVLLDIRMPGIDGLAVAGSSKSLPPIVFTTAYNEYAVEAFNVAAVDYLLKPIQRERLVAALDRVRERSAPAVPQLQEVLERIAGGDRREPSPVAARFGGTVRVFDPRDIARFYASEKYTLFRHEGREYVLDEALSALEARLGEFGFLRVHRGELINLKSVTTVRTEDGATLVELSDGSSARVARRSLAALKSKLGIR